MKLRKVRGVIVSQREGNCGPLRPMLETLGIEPLDACNCAEAEQLLSDTTSVHLVLTDAVLADGNWLDVLDLAAKAKEKINVVVVSPRADIRLYVEVMNHGAFDFITENSTVSEVVYVIRNAMDNARQARTKPTLVPSSFARFKGTASERPHTESPEAD
jgi:DNA-binding NtrC family response regulator